MIVECEECESKFNLNENLLKAGGSKVRCTKCKHVFTAYPPEAVREEAADDNLFDEDMEETLALESRPVFEEEEEFGKAFEEAMEESETVQTMSPDDIPEEEDDEPADLEEAMERAAQIEEELTGEGAGEEGSEAPTMAVGQEKDHPVQEKENQTTPVQSIARYSYSHSADLWGRGGSCVLCSGVSPRFPVVYQTGPEAGCNGCRCAEALLQRGQRRLRAI